MNIDQFRKFEKSEIHDAIQRDEDLMEIYRFLDQVQEASTIPPPKKRTRKYH